MIVIGVDPGLTGAISFIDGRGSVVVEDIPTMPLGGNGMVTRKVDGLALARLVRNHCPASEDAMVVCEAVRVMGGKNNAIQTQGSLMRTLGAVEAVFEVLRFSVLMVEPQTWKKHFGLKSDKAASLEAARTLYPSCQAITRKKDHNRAESLLLAHYGRTVLA